MEFQKDRSSSKQSKAVKSLQKTTAQGRQLFPLTNREVKGVIGEGFVADASYLLAWEPGIGKSTFALQLLRDLQRWTSDLARAYFSGEETANQVITRFSRLYPEESQNDEVFYTNSLEEIIEAVKTHRYKFIIVDSIQTIRSIDHTWSAGSIGQVRHCAEALNNLAKEHHVTVLIIGHVNKWWDIAWPKYLEHIVDVVLYIEWNRTWELRFLRNYKNRFWHADGTGIFEMRGRGLQPVYDPAKLYEDQPKAPGIAWTIGLDNGRPVIIWIETLLTKSYEKYPTRNYVWVPKQRVEMIVAILEKYLWCKLGNMNIFLNIPGETYYNDSGLDLAIAMAIYSAYEWKTLPDKTLWIWELGLTGRIAKTRSHDKRRGEVLEWWTTIDHQETRQIQDLK